jgi:hypothetical protein
MPVASILLGESLERLDICRLHGNQLPVNIYQVAVASAQLQIVCDTPQAHRPQRGGAALQSVGGVLESRGIASRKRCL